MVRVLARSYGVEERVTINRWTDDPRGQYAEHDVLLMCSHSEAFGRVTVEAMKSRLAVVGAAGGATPEIIDDGRTGLLFPVRDSAALGARLVELWGDEARRASLASAGQTAAMARFSLEAYVRDFLAVAQGVRALT
jgi:glycosyltransferase involved in cell wall biosynthesis